MNRTTLHLATRRDRGYILVAMMALTMALLGTGIAFMQWATDESIQGTRAQTSMQAYYVAQSGVIERGLTWLYTQQAGLMPQTVINLSDGTVGSIGRYKNVKISPVFGSIDNNSLFSFDQKYKIEAIGIVNAPWEEREVAPDTAKAILYVQVRSFVDYMYLTNWETSATFPGDIVRFFGRDTLWGRVHSNDWIATQNVGGLPVACSIVSTTKPSFRSGSPNPAFNFDYCGGSPLFDQPEVLLPELAESIRANATRYDFPGEEYYLSIRGGSATVYHWPEGTELDTLAVQNFSFPITESTCVFFEGRMRMRGVMNASGCNLTIGCSEDIRLIDNVMLEGTNMTNGTLAPNATSILGIVSEQWIYIANTWENGRENKTGTPPNNRDIVLTAAIVSLRGSFQFEQMNDDNDPYISPTTPDERGNIVMTGSITQWRRGYVHRSNRGGSGYNKVYHYDNRFGYRRPPCFLGASDEDGRVLLNMIQWGQASEDPVDVAAQRRVRYN